MTDRLAEIRKTLAQTNELGEGASRPELRRIGLDALVEIDRLTSAHNEVLDNADVSHKKAHRFSLERDEARARVAELEAVVRAADVLRAVCDRVDRYHDDAQPYCMVCGASEDHGKDCAVPTYDVARAKIEMPEPKP